VASCIFGVNMDYDSATVDTNLFPCWLDGSSDTIEILSAMPL
jgi:hypothetical protein